MNEINLEEIINKVKSEGFYIFHNYINRELTDLIKKEYFSAMDSISLKPAGEKLNPSRLSFSPWRKLAVGSKNGLGEKYSQVLQTMYFSQNDSNRPSLSYAFNHLINLRNNLSGMRLDYGGDLDNDQFWNACRVHHYPCGGGHMAMHRDTGFPVVLKDFQIPFVQIMLTLTSRGSGFDKGGGYIVKPDNTTVFFENDSNEGSLVIFDGNTLHGVDDIDPNGLLDFSSKQGRIALFVNLYRNLSLELEDSKK